jgi:hypothetical protein
MYAIADTREFPVLPDADGFVGAPAGSAWGLWWLDPWNDLASVVERDAGAQDAVAHELPPPHAQCYNVVHVDGHVAQIAK